MRAQERRARKERKREKKARREVTTSEGLKGVPWTILGATAVSTTLQYCISLVDKDHRSSISHDTSTSRPSYPTPDRCPSLHQLHERTPNILSHTARKTRTLAEILLDLAHMLYHFLFIWSMRFFFLNPYPSQLGPIRTRFGSMETGARVQ
jgi:hypothetical protein